MTATAAAALAAARMAPLGWVAPPLGGPARSARAIAATLLTLLVLPSLQAQVEPPRFMTALVTELLAGVLLGLLTTVPIAAAQSAGALLDASTQPWRLLQQSARPATGPLGDGYRFFALALFAAFDGPRLVIVAAAASYHALPLGRGLDAVSLAAVLAVGARLVAVAVTLAAPALAALLVADLGVAAIARAQPALARSLDAAPLRLGVALVAAAAAAVAAAHALSRALADAAALKLQP